MVTMLAMRIDKIDKPVLETTFYKKNIKKRPFSQKQTMRNAFVALMIMGAVLFCIDLIFLSVINGVTQFMNQGLTLSKMQIILDDYGIICLKHVLFSLFGVAGYTVLMHLIAKRSSYKMSLVRLYKI